MAKIKKLKKKLKDHERILEDQANLIKDYHEKVQSEITDLTRHFMGSIEPTLRKFVRSEVEKYFEEQKSNETPK